MRFLLAQILGIVALILVCISYFLKSRPKFLTLQALADVFYAGAFFVVEAYVGAVITTISIFRCMYIYWADKYDFKRFIPFLSIFIVLYIIATIVFWQTPLDIIPPITGTLFTIGYIIKNLQIMRYVFIIPNVLLILYNVLSTTYASAVLDMIELAVLIVAIIKFNRCKSKDIILN